MGLERVSMFLPFLPILVFLYPPSIQQAFVDEMATTGKVLWLEEVKSSSDKLGLIAKVLSRPY